MATAQLDAVRRVFNRVRDRAADHPDGDLLGRFIAVRDEEAFGLLVRRHGPMVFGVCRRVLHDSHAAEDAFQATFLVLAKRAAAVRPPGVLGAWLYGVAYRTALKARGREVRRRQVEQDYANETSRGASPPRNDESGSADLRRVIDQQLNALPEKYRVPLVLCAVQGLGKVEAAERLGLPEGTVSSRLARAREMLRDRLTRRGIVVPAASLVPALVPDSLSAAVPPKLIAVATQTAVGVAPIPPAVLTLSREVLTTMTLAKWKLLGTLAVAVALTGGGFGIYTSADERKPGTRPAPDKPAAVKPGDKPRKPAAEGEKPRREGERKPPVIKLGGTVDAVDAKAGTITLIKKGDGGPRETVVKLTDDAKVLIDGKPGRLADVPKGAVAAFGGATLRDGRPVMASEVRITGPVLTGLLDKADRSSLTVSVGGKEKPVTKTLKLTADTRIDLGAKEGAKPTDLKPGDNVTVIPTVDGTTALVISAGAKDRPEGGKPAKPRKLFGQIGVVDAKAGTVSLVRMGEGGPREDVVKLTPDARVTIDGKEAKPAELPKGGAAELVLASARDGKQLEVSEVAVNTIKFTGIVKEATADSVTLLGGPPGSSVPDRVLKLAPGGKVLIDGRPAKLSDLQAGDRANIVMTADRSAAARITVGTKGDGEKPKKKPGDSPE
jgi:RNA polymerase sigma factor (sigma-70 family)